MRDKGPSFSEWRSALRSRSQMQELENMVGQYNSDSRDPEVVQALSNMARLITTVSKTVSGIHDDLEALKYDTNRSLRDNAEKVNKANEQMLRYMYFTWIGGGVFVLIQILNWFF